jgi:acyl-CoA thioester hydrolase
VTEPQPSPSFELRFAPAAADIDELGHVSNLVWLRYVLEAARAHSTRVGLDHAAYVALGAVFVVRRHEIDYLGPAFAGQELVTTTFVASWGAATSERRTRIARASDGQELVRAVTTWAFVSMESGRPRRIPADVRAAFARPPVGVGVAGP